jgi:carbon-monoxide dehydrogenase large subunit
MSTKWFGAPILRRDDDRLLKGQGRYFDDISLPGMAHVAFLRSTHPSAAIRRIDAALAQAMEGVIEVVSHVDLGPAGEPFPQLLPHHGLASATWAALAPGRVCFTGEAIAAVVAESRVAAADAVDKIEVEYDPEPPVLDLEAAVRPGSRLVHPDAPRNVAMHLVESAGDVEAALRKAPHRLKERFWLTRGAGMPIEPRGVVANYDLDRRELTIWSSTQEPHAVRNIVAHMLGLSRHLVRVIAPDTGGGFGTKLNVYPEEVLIPWLALRLRRPVKWLESRSEHMLTATQEREQIHDVEVGFDDDGVVQVVKNTFYHDMGAYAPRGAAVPHNTSSALLGPYRISTFRSEMTAVYTNRATVSAYRGAGQPQGVFLIERVMDRIALQLEKDPAEVRRINTIPADLFPYDTKLTNLLGGKVEYDSGDFIAMLQKALDAADYPALRAAQAEARKAGRYVGIGIANYIELTGRGPWEGSGVRVEPDGRVTVFIGAPSQGQGHETVFAQICADQLGVPLDKITVLGGDTALIQHGIGTFASRVGVLAGNAVNESSIAVRKKILSIAGDLLEASEADLVLENGVVSIAGVPGRSVSLAAVAKESMRGAGPHEEAPGLEAIRYFKAPKMTYSNGTHVAAVEVDVETGMVKILNYALAHDCGRIINPMIVEGQIWGGIACGIGNALLEEHAYDKNGQLLTGSFMDYAMPGASHIPDVKIVHQETPSTLNPLGVRGAGEAGTIPVPAVIGNAVEDALRPLGIKINAHPLTPVRLWKLLQGARAA